MTRKLPGEKITFTVLRGGELRERPGQHETAPREDADAAAERFGIAEALRSSYDVHAELPPRVRIATTAAQAAAYFK